MPYSFGSFFSWSVTNEKRPWFKDVKRTRNVHQPLGFPFNRFFVFLLLSIMSLVIALFAFMLPKELEKKKLLNKKLPTDKIEEEEEEEEANGLL